MQKIKYEFADGTTSEIEVTDELYALHLELVQQEKRNHWKETRRHISLNYLTENGIDFEDKAADSLSAYLRREDDERIHNAITKLLPEQQALIKKIFYEGKTITEIAKAENVGKSAIANRLTRIYIKIKNFFLN
ncbi:MAG: sigma-70 family RNA polymerase sigma factor [Clostridia bacterium]|jgi:RNA polymerase sigma factor (sigma-70 family)|nr:sigma-70 family RNA polymerase sigma factor [Clostridia bacterium]